jgi:TIR domain
MRYSGIGYLNEDGIFQIHRNILESLSIFDDAILFGIYYPTNKKDEQVKDEIFSPDFMFTPIPYTLWPKTARIIVRVKKQAEAFREITKVLKNNNVTILNSVSNRSAHRYSTWDIHIAFEDVEMEKTDVKSVNGKKNGEIVLEKQDEYGFDNSTQEYRIINTKLIALYEKIKEIPNANEILFEDKREKALNSSITMRTNTALHYFYYNAELEKKRREEKRGREETSNKEDAIGDEIHKEIYDFLFKPFSVRYVRGNLIVENDMSLDIGKIMPNSGGKISNILYISYKNKEKLYNLSDENNTKNLSCDDTDYNYQKISPTITFVEADSHFLGIRIVVLPKRRMPHFVKLDVYYQRQNNPYSSRGLLEYISSKLPDYYKIWKYHNRLFECRESYGSGKLTFYLEDERMEANYELNSFTEELQWGINKLNKLIDEEDIPYLKDFQLKAKAYNIKEVLEKQFKINNSIKKENITDVFISYSSEDRKEANLIKEVLNTEGLKCYFTDKELKGGDVFSENIREALVNTREVCLLYSPNSKISSWVNTEWGAAWALQKRITPVLLDLTVNDVLPEHDRLKNLHYVKFRNDELKQYAKDVFRRRFTP